ncbi:family 1 glycosylhydrolase [Micromonospora sp. BRA006-A]|nr:family 1 glycosylhydrolase [Micromonospora sp. BRA006-A]
MYDILTRVTRDAPGADHHHRERPALPRRARPGRHRRRRRAGRLPARPLRRRPPGRRRQGARWRATTSGRCWTTSSGPGYEQRWGLVYVDYASQRRVLKRSAHWYRDVIRRNGL